MSRQGYLFGDTRKEVVADERAISELRVLSWNVQSPSYERAHEQFEWILATGANVVVLTELNNGRGSLHLASSLEACRFQIFFTEPSEREYSTLFAVKGMPAREQKMNITHLSSRVTSNVINTFLGELLLVGLYAPSRSPGESANAFRRRTLFHEEFTSALRTALTSKANPNCIVVGDLNVVERNHIPHDPMFAEDDFRFYESFAGVGLRDTYRMFAPSTVEHSWFGPTGQRQRIDHAFCSEPVLRKARSCTYDASPRETRLSDHSALLLAIQA